MEFNEQGSIKNCLVCGKDHIFPTREEWEQRERTVYLDMVFERPWVSSKLSDYATAKEIADGVRTLEQTRKDMLRNLERVSGLTMIVTAL
jgi:hypothetical protein